MVTLDQRLHIFSIFAIYTALFVAVLSTVKITAVKSDRIVRSIFTIGHLGVKCDGLLQLDKRQVVTVEMLTPPGSRMSHNVLYNPDLGVIPRALVPAEKHPLL